MKKVLAITCVLVLVLLVSSVVFAAENNWRFKIRADDNAGAMYSDSQVGMYPTSLDTYDAQDRVAAYLATPDGATVAAWCSGTLTDRTEQFYADIKQKPLTGAQKAWDLRVYALKDATYSNLRLQFFPMSTSTAIAPPSSVNGIGVVYYLKMVNNRGVSGAPANGTRWDVPLPTVLLTTVSFFDLVLPVNVLSVSTYAAAEAEGYVMEFGMEPIPEPSALLALGTGVAGLAGFVMRRRRV